MTRPADWSPLADKDPIGGDVSAVSTQAKYYRDLADPDGHIWGPFWMDMAAVPAA